MNKRLNELIEVANRISRGEIPEYQHNECFTSGAFDLLLINSHGPEAFELLTELCGSFNLIASQSNNVAGFYCLASQLATLSKTTEMPEGMENIIKSNRDLSQTLQQWYRYNG